MTKDRIELGIEDCSQIKVKAQKDANLYHETQTQSSYLQVFVDYLIMQYCLY